MRLRGGLKTSVERGLVASGLPACAIRGRRRATLILAYHNVIPDDMPVDGERSLHLPLSRFAAQLDSLGATHDVVSLDSIIDGRPPSGDRPRAVITFDDAYRGAATHAIREVAARGFPATIFVAPAFVGGRTFWWDATTPSGAPGPSDDFRSTALETCRGRDDAIREWARASGYEPRPMPHDAVCASEEELRAAAAQPGIALASHSWSHPNLCRLDGMELERELARPLAWLAERFPNVLPIISYPYGRSSPAVEQAAARAGYRAGVRIDRGWMTPPVRNPLGLPRLNVPAGLSLEGFVLRTAGVLR